MNRFLKGYRWRILALLFFITTVNYIDRQVISFTVIDEEFQRAIMNIPEGDAITEEHHAEFNEVKGWIDASFKIAYALGFILVGWFVDRIGTRKGFASAMTIWGFAAIGTGFVGSIGGLLSLRFLLGFGEAGNFPASIKTVAEWFPKRERSFATGIFNAGTNVGVILTALFVPWIILSWGWEYSFIITGLVGFVLLYFWLKMYKRPEEHENISKEELELINSDADEKDNADVTKVPWARLFKYRQTWAFAAGKFMTDCVWWMFLFWLPSFFQDSQSLDQNLDLKSIGLPFILIYLVSDVGSIFYGWLATRFIEKGWTVNKARKVTMLICGITVIPIFFASMTDSLVVAIALIAIATSAHQGFSCNLFSLVSDMFPKKAVASVVGIGGVWGAIGGTILTAATGYIVNAAGYLPIFIYASCAYLIALLLIHLLAPKLERAKL
ncbi:ACS family hexuronate transporter-like MFS transporter [Anseongella ginsenosidimutans]|uniref:ACS family hexuronate transporter-like MFS transporter n=1 Tax=Anseongella ginsenosidimutans TaxID=496056 RepID=A0A4R3KPW0_9SPHI|nr:MFS transporter [Anseongella ginsenosidimutans]QEC52246.1 MFS transporter [Anseongella ginsenosidimutans]TCS86798.1 ACS family hexuronate transporter-like MFS transporter [Anseongella ginsenosidimutans]